MLDQSFRLVASFEETDLAEVELRQIKSIHSRNSLDQRRIQATSANGKGRLPDVQFLFPSVVISRLGIAEEN